jgi:hypothetical protein
MNTNPNERKNYVLYLDGKHVRLELILYLYTSDFPYWTSQGYQLVPKGG